MYNKSTVLVQANISVHQLFTLVFNSFWSCWTKPVSIEYHLPLCLPGLSLLGSHDGENVWKQHKFDFCCHQLCASTLHGKQTKLLVPLHNIFWLADIKTYQKTGSSSCCYVCLLRSTVVSFQAQLWEHCPTTLEMLLSSLRRLMRWGYSKVVVNWYHLFHVNKVTSGNNFMLNRKSALKWSWSYWVSQRSWIWPSMPLA